MNGKNCQLSREGMQAILKTKYIGHDFHFFESVTSTFDASKNCEIRHGSVVCAKEQTAGRGRLGRTWQSQSGGIYFSLILNPGENQHDFQLMTVICALGVCRALSTFLPCFIKWPNDIVSESGKKLCGILSKIEFSDGKPGFVNVGIGINANTDSFSDELKYAASLKLLIGREVDENYVLSKVLFEIEKCLECDEKAIIDEFSAVCCTLGAEVKAIYTDGNTLEGICKSIEPDGSLTIQKKDGTEVNVNSGEVSVRGIYDDRYV